MKYLFNEIRFISGSKIQFIPFREATFLESFLANTKGCFNQEEWEFVPKSFNEFLKMLKLTKIQYNEDYDITAPYTTLKDKRNFDDVLKTFASYVYREKVPNEKELAKFYSKAYQIRQKTLNDCKTLKKKPNELI